VVVSALTIQPKQLLTGLDLTCRQAVAAPFG
jgi:hypothetical protein